MKPNENTQKTRPSTGTAGTRSWALIRKEARQMLRDRSTLTLGILLPIVLLLLFGFGLSLDVRNVPVAVIHFNSSPQTRDLFTALNFSPYFSPIMVNSSQEAEQLLRSNRVDAIIRRDIKERADGNEKVQIIVNGRDSNTARIIQRYLEGATVLWMSGKQSGRSFLSNGTPPEKTTSSVGRATVETRIWYNNALESHFFLIPGVTALIMTLIGTLLTALVIAREWERGTYEALVATPAQRGEIIAGKIVPYFVLGMVGLALCLFAATWIFGVPMRGSPVLIVTASAIYLLVSLGIGLFISATVKNQFLASQIVLIVSFLPTVMLSGFIFDLKSAPVAAYYLAHVFPATWYVDLLQTLFLVGNVRELVIRDFMVLSAFAVLMLSLAGANIRKSLE